MKRVLIITLLLVGAPTAMVLTHKMPEDVYSGALIVNFLIGFYFLPFIVAFLRGHRQTLPIFFTNLFLGWTFLGWVVSFIWACTADRFTVQMVHRYE